ncbi:MAG TPA: PUA domain-containing protein [Nitrososphaera sp.]
MNPLPVDPLVKVSRHVDAIFGAGVSETLPKNLNFEFSRRTGRIKNFSLDGKLLATLRTDGGLALTIDGARHFVQNSKQFRQNCVVPVDDAVPFVSEGRSLFCRHVQWSGQNVRAGSDVAVLDGDGVIAVGVAVLGSALMNRFSRGVAVKVREGIKGRTD